MKSLEKILRLVTLSAIALREIPLSPASSLALE
jgi:hypothetical protein